MLIFRQEADGWKVAHSGISLPYRVAAQAGEVYPLEDLHNRNRQLEALIESRTRELEDANRRLEKLSRMDGLTGIANRRSFDRMLAQEWSRAQRASAPLSLIMLDVDHFKHFNDHYGHPAGDKVIQLVAEVVREVIRESDIAGRYGGEEFVVLLPDVDKIGARLFAERLRQLVEALVVDYEGQEIRFTISLGVADLGQRTQDHQQLIDWADRALYQSKHGGRNQVSVHGG